MNEIANFIVDNIWHILWILGFLNLLWLEILGIMNPRVNALTHYVWIAVGYDKDDRWSLNWRKVVFFVLWMGLSIVLASHFLFGKP